MITRDLRAARPASPTSWPRSQPTSARTGVDVIYGTVRLIERDDESFLAWARDRWACVIFNLHTVHTRRGSSTPRRRSAA